jgi:hypothetical protein
MAARLITRLVAIVALVLLAACASSQTRVAANVTPASIPAGAKVLIVPPDVQLSLLMASGMQEPKADWSKSATDHFSAVYRQKLETRGHQVRTIPDMEAAYQGRIGQVLRLHEAVMFTIYDVSYSGLRLPTKTQRQLDWTVGDGAKLLAETYGADYALVTLAVGNYASRGRRALAVVGVAAMFAGIGGGLVPMGQQTIYVVLTDLKTGEIVWSQIAQPGAAVDIREAAGVSEMVDRMLKTAPL